MSVLSEKIAWWDQVNARDRECRANNRAIENGEGYYVSPNSGKVVKTRWC